MNTHLRVHTHTHTHKDICDTHLGISPNGATAFGACVGTELVEALCTHVLLILLNILLPMQVVTAVVTVEAFSHGGSSVAPGSCTNTHNNHIYY